jgi:hypothetical protein
MVFLLRRFKIDPYFPFFKALSVSFFLILYEIRIHPCSSASEKGFA